MPPYQSIFSMGRDYGAYGTPQQWQDIERTSRDTRFGGEARTMLANRDRSYVDPLTGGYSVRSSMPYQSSNLDSRYSMPFSTSISPQSLSGLVGGQPGGSGGDYFSSLASGPQSAQGSNYVQGPIAGMMVKRESPEDAFHRMNYGMNKAEWDRARGMQEEQFARERENYMRIQDQIRNSPRPRISNQPQTRPSSSQQAPSGNQTPPINPYNGQSLGQFLGSFGPGQFSGQSLGQFLGGGFPNTQPATGGGLTGPSSPSNRMSRRFASPERMTSPSRLYGSQRSFFA